MSCPPTIPRQPSHVPSNLSSMPHMILYAPGPGQTKGKQVRATQACTYCRERKHKCDEAKPCKLCQEYNIDCKYEDVRMSKQEQTVMQLEDGIASLRNLVAENSEMLKNFFNDLNNWRQKMEGQLPVLPPAQSYSNLHPSPLAHPTTPVKQEYSTSFLPSFTSAESANQAPKSGAFDTDHATPAHKLLPEWAAEYQLHRNIPALRKLADAGKDIIDYPIYYEQGRGLLRVWGVGEGHDSTDGVQGVVSPGSQTDVDSPSSASTVDHSSPNTVNGDTSRCESLELLADRKPDFRYNTLMDLVHSYTKHIHVLHPVLDLYQLDIMVKTFAKLYCPDHVSATLANEIPIQRSLCNAIVLLVLALGKVSKHRTTLPSPQSELDSSHSHDSPYPANHSFRSKVLESRPRNIDILPGMIYYSYASDILGNQYGGNTVAHAQAMILSSLYLAQYGRVLESWSWINNACRIALVLIQADYPRINRDHINRHGTNGAAQEPAEPKLRPKERHRLNMVKFIYWTCLSLETDIRAEMSTLPSTRISHYQSNIIYPEGAHSNDENLFIYTSLMHVRVLLNDAHISLYSCERRKSNDVLTNSKHTATLLTEWRTVLPPLLTWHDEDLPSIDPNLARLRAKVHGAMYVILRPCLLAAIQLFKDAPYSSSFNGQHADLIKVSTDCIRSAIQSTIAFDRIGADPDSPYENYVSTRTGRLILTNIVGTLHAQFGNMIVLAAVWNSKMMSYLPTDTLTFKTLSQLFHRTIKILEEMAPNSPILKIDLDILNEIRGQLQLKTC